MFILAFHQAPSTGGKGSQELVPEVLQAEHFKRPKGGWVVPRRQAHGAFVDIGMWAYVAVTANRLKTTGALARLATAMATRISNSCQIRHGSFASMHAGRPLQPVFSHARFKAWCFHTIQVFSGRSVEMALACQ